MKLQEIDRCIEELEDIFDGLEEHLQKAVKLLKEYRAVVVKENADREWERAYPKKAGSYER